MEREDEGAINGPVVFSCNQCRTIVGDTFSYVATIPERNIFALHSVPDSVVCSKSKRMSSEKGEEGSVYFELECQECQQSLGRRYLTTIEEMDAIRNAYALDITKLITYELGKSIQPQNARDTSGAPPPEFYTSLEFHDDMCMVKNNITAIAARLQKLEQNLMASRKGSNAIASTPSSSLSSSLLSPSPGHRKVGRPRKRPLPPPHPHSHPHPPLPPQQQRPSTTENMYQIDPSKRFGG